MPSTTLCPLASRRRIIPKHLQNPRLFLGFSAGRDVDRDGRLWDKGAGKRGVDVGTSGRRRRNLPGA
jgi:hypothetical protein